MELLLAVHLCININAFIAKPRKTPQYPLLIIPNPPYLIPAFQRKPLPKMTMEAR